MIDQTAFYALLDSISDAALRERVEDSAINNASHTMLDRGYKAQESAYAPWGDKQEEFWGVAIDTAKMILDCPREYYPELFVTKEDETELSTGVSQMLKLVVETNTLASNGVNGDAAIGYLSADMTAVTTFDGLPLGTARVVKSWGDVAERTYQVECMIDGRAFTGRSAGSLMFWHGKAKKERKPTGYALLTRPDSQPKAVKGQKKGVMTFVLHLAPADLSGHEVCAMRTAACTYLCLNTAGRGAFNTTQAARIRKTSLYFSDRALFMALLAADIRKAIRYATKRGFKAAFRLNGTSDIPWHRVPVEGAECIMDLFPDVQFYDYTKVAKRVLRETLPRNYHLTFSLTEDNDAVAAQVLARGGNVAAIFRNRALVESLLQVGSYTIGGFTAPLVDGDDTDVRYMDKPGSVIALYAKGTKAKRDSSGMVRDI